MITIGLMALLLGAAVGLAICLLVTFAIWLVFSRHHAAIRTIVFVASVLLMGSVAGEPWTRETPSEVFMGTIALVLSLVAIALLMRNRTTNIIVATAVLLLLGYYPIAQAFESSGSPTYCDASFRILFAVAALIPLRLIGYRLLRLTGSVSDRDLELGTGQGIDQWLVALCDAGADRMERAEIASFLRREGIPFTWQKLLADAYELSSGRHVVSQRIDGKPQTVQATGQNLLATIANGLREHRSSISQWLAATALIAFVCAVAHQLRWQFPELYDIWWTGVTSLAGGLMATSALYFRLRPAVQSRWSRWSRAMVHWSAVAGVALSFPLLLGFHPPNSDYGIAAVALVFVAIWLSVIFRLLSYEGYRLVWVQTVNQGPMLATGGSFRDSLGRHEAGLPRPAAAGVRDQIVGS